MTNRIALITCIALIVTASVVHGLATHRWASLSPNVDRSANAHAFVWQLGDYTCEDVPSELPVKERSTVTCRRYTSSSLGSSVVVSITSGPPGAVSTHTPDVCYPGSGYRTVRAPRKETIDLPGGGTATFMVADYEKRTATSHDRHRIRWSWSVDGQWSVPDNPRFAFLSRPELFKLYVVTPVSDAEAERADLENPAVRDAVQKIFADYSAVLSR